MKNLQQTEKQLADKLQNVPVPDVDQGWEQMRRLLDRDMPEPVAGAWSGNRKWWWMGITAGIIMLATWLTQELNNNAVQADKQAGKTPGVVSTGNNAKNNSEAKNTDAARINEANNNNNNNSKSSNNQISDNKTAEATVTTNEVKNENAKTLNDVSAKKNAIAPIDIKVNSASNDVTPKRNTVRKPTTDNRDIVLNPTNVISKKQSLRNQRNVPFADDQTKNTVDDNTIISKPAITNETEPSLLNISIDTENERSAPATQFNEVNNLQPEQVAVSGKTDKAFAREMRKKSMKDDNRRISRSSMRGGSRDNEKELTFAAGLALPQSFAVGGQHASSYNVNGGSGRITDYLPAPFFQYHINNKLFVQTEFHFQSPQYTQRLLLSRSVDTFASRVYENNVKLEKLYYFNIPFNVYYSPARNFYLGGGVQYSSLLSGVASYENRTTEGQTVLSHASVARRFNYDSVAAAFTSSEWRYQLDANYYFNRFTLGLRFNRAMTDFIDIRGGGYVPPTRDRNKSFLLYLRFNIWEERKKEN